VAPADLPLHYFTYSRMQSRPYCAPWPGACVAVSSAPSDRQYFRKESRHYCPTHGGCYLLHELPGRLPLACSRTVCAVGVTSSHETPLRPTSHGPPPCRET